MDKITALESRKLIAAIGEPRYRLLTKYLRPKAAYRRLVDWIPLTTAAAADFICGELATLSHKRPKNMLLAGYDKEAGPSPLPLYHTDYNASLDKIEKGDFSDGSKLPLSMMENHFHSGMLLQEAIHFVDKCILEIRSRLVVESPKYAIKIVQLFKDEAGEYAWRKLVKDSLDFQNI